MKIQISEVKNKMLIRKIQIENVKTHKDTTITFNEGLNVLYGNNGTGKSTVLEMIGYVLFDFLKSKTQHSDYVRSVENDKPEYGSIKIWINGLNNKIYTIKRKIGKTDIEVKDEKGKEVSPQIETISKFRSWIKHQLGVKNNIDLQTLFNTAIGIPQGMIINIFLRSPKERKEYFDEIFQLDTYEEYWDNLGVIERSFRDELVTIQNQISELTGETKEKESKVRYKKEVSKEIDNKSKKLNEFRREKQKIKNELDDFKSTKGKLDEITSTYRQLEVKKKNEEQNLVMFQQQLKESSHAKEVVNDTKDDYQQYLKNSEMKEELIKESEELSRLKEKLNEMNQKYQNIKNKYSNKKEKLNEAKNSSKIIKEIEPKYEGFLKLESKIKKLDEQIAVIKAAESRLNKKKERVSSLKKNINTIKKEVENLPKLKEKLENIKTLEQKKNTLALEISSIKNDISFFQNHQNKVEQKLCPFTDQQCKNMLDGEFDIDYFNQDIILKNEELKSKRRDLNEISEKLKKKEDFQDEIEHLKRNAIKLEEFEKQYKSMKEEINEINSKITEKSQLINSKKKLMEKREALQPFHDDYLIHKRKVEDLKDIENQLEELKVEVEEVESKKENLKSKIAKLGNIPDKLSAIRKKLNNLEKAYNQYQKNINEAEKLKQRKEKVNRAKQRLENLVKQYSESLEELKELSAKYNEVTHKKLQEEFDEKNRNIIKLEENLRNLQQRLDEINEELENLESKEKKLDEFKEIELKLEAEKKFVSKIRNWLKDFKPKMRQQLIQKVNRQASKIYRNIRGDQNTSLQWDQNYEIEILKAKSKKKFIRLSGGEKMAAALAVRLAILKTLTSAKFAIFDEPTTNLDETSRNNLSKYINNIEGFNQLFVISHDDSFKRHSEYVIKLSKDNNESTQVSYLTNV